MHELSICHSILEIADATLADLPPPRPRVLTITVRVGRLTSVVPDSLRFCFDILAPSTSLDGSSLVIEEVPIRGRCTDCAARFEIETLTFTCPVCGSGLVELLSGRELEVVSLETVEEVTSGY